MSECGRCDDCLCDVVVSNTVAIANIDFANQSYHARRIVQHLDLSAPWTPEKILQFLTFQAELKDQLAFAERLNVPSPVTPEGKRNTFAANAKLTAEMRQLIATMVIDGSPSAIIRAEVKRLYGIDVSASHMSHMRKRVFKKDTL